MIAYIEELEKLNHLRNLLSGLDCLSISEEPIDIEKDLDIVRGVIPTPKGYKVNKDRIRRYMKAQAK